MSGNYAYVADGYWGLAILDLTPVRRLLLLHGPMGSPSCLTPTPWPHELHLEYCTDLRLGNGRPVVTQPASAQRHPDGLRRQRWPALLACITGRNRRIAPRFCSKGGGPRPLGLPCQGPLADNVQPVKPPASAPSLGGTGSTLSPFPRLLPERHQRGIFHPQISPIHADEKPERICEICVLCGFVFQGFLKKESVSAGPFPG